MIVSNEMFNKVKEEIYSNKYISLDIETTGLELHKDDYIIGMGIATETNIYYFNFISNEDNTGAIPLPKYILDKSIITTLLNDYTGTIFMHNAKYDSTGLAKEGVNITKLNIYCTQVGARVILNNRYDFSLNSLANELGLAKSDAVKSYMQKNKMFSTSIVLGRKRTNKKGYFNKVPLHLMGPYCEKDAYITYKLGMDQIKNIDVKGNNVLRNEFKLIHTLRNMEGRGILIDVPYIKEAISYYQNELESIIQEFLKIADEKEFKDSNKYLATVFTKLKIPYGKTEKGNPSFTDDILQTLQKNNNCFLLITYLQKIRSMSKKLNTYFAPFISFADNNNIIHTDFKASGTATGRLSCASPNLQNLNKNEDVDEKYFIRRCFIPRKDYTFYMFDYKQMEYRLMLDYAGEQKVIDEVKAGLDLHQAIADKVGIRRDQAKIINFMLLYGGGVEKLAYALSVSINEATKLKKQYFSKLPKVVEFINKVIQKAEKTGSIHNWFGRIYYFSEDYYKAPNYLIQGGCADVIKCVLNEVHNLLINTKSNILVTIHDEILCEIHNSETYLIPKIKTIMENIYPGRYLNLDVDISYSDISWHDKKEYKLT